MSDWDEFDTETLPAALRRLGPVSGGDILVFRNLDDEVQRNEIVEAVLHYYRDVAESDPAALAAKGDRAAAHCPLLVFLPEGVGLEHLDEAEMLRLGWKWTDPKEVTP